MLFKASLSLYHSMLYPPNSPPSFSLPYSTPIFPLPYLLTLNLQPLLSLPPHPAYFVVMECVNGPFKSSFRPETAAKMTQQAFLEDLSSASAGDDFFVDELLDFSKAGVEHEFVTGDDEEEEEEHEKNERCILSLISPLTQQKTEDKEIFVPGANTVSLKDDFGSLLGGELTVPADDLAHLEWLSHFVDDSFSEFPLTFNAGKLSQTPPVNKPEPENFPEIKPCFTTPAQTKARSKRARTGGRIWSFGSPSLTESSTSSSNSSSSTTNSSPAANPWLIYTVSVHTAESFLGTPQPKKPKRPRKTESETGPGGGCATTQQPRRCSHCGVQKTPQWRAGPLGAKTLCNACGVRYKSGRLLPEYRPACSPTFSSGVHSNNHRKVLEMRRTKEVESGLAPTVQSF